MDLLNARNTRLTPHFRMRQFQLRLHGGMDSDYGPFSSSKASGRPTPLGKETHDFNRSHRNHPAECRHLGHRPGSLVDRLSVRHLMVSKVRGNFEKFSGAIVVAEGSTRR